MRVMICEPNKDAYMKEIGNSLKDMQEIVGGYIEAVYPCEKPICIVCNEEGKLIELPFSRSLKDENGDIYDLIAGTFFICDCSGEDFDSLTEDEEKIAFKMFGKAEDLSSVENCIRYY